MKPKIQHARRMRREATPAEAKLWYHLRNRNMMTFKFRRQAPIGNYVADFLCERAQIVNEVDGSQHLDRSNEDARRMADIEAMGYIVLRFWNVDVLTNTNGVLSEIWRTLDMRGASD